MITLKETVKYQSLCKELERLNERFEDYPEALEALQAVQIWAFDAVAP